MKSLRIFIPVFRFILKKSSKGYGIGKKQPVKTIFKLMDQFFRADIVDVHGHKMLLPKKGFDEYSTLGIYGELDTSSVENLINKGDYVVDVGAAIGYYTLILARAVGPKGLVFAFEPKIERFEILKKNIELNGYTNVILENKAVLPLEIKPTFFNMKNSHGGIRLIKNFETKNDHLEPVITDVIDLDTYFKKKNNQNQISFIKIDVDGPELFVLQSSKSILNNKHLKILIEWDKNLSKKSDCDPNEIIDLLFKNGFKIYYPDYSNKKYFLVNKDELLKLESTDTINLLCKKD